MGVVFLLVYHARRTYNYRMSFTIQLIFWVSLFGLFYTYIGYPGLIHVLSRFFPRPARTGPVKERCAVVISAYNEADTLPAKLRALLSGPNADWIDEIWVGSDGSDDGTETALEALDDPRIHVVRFERRRGKPAVLNDLVPRCHSPYIVFTDARQELEPRALEHLLANFADERVGVVSGELVFRRSDNGSSTASGMDTYWRYEKFIRRAEGRVRSVPGATGALYAIRRELFSSIRSDILLDDVAIPLLIVLQGRRCVFEEAAIVYDVPSESGKAEEIRKRRTIAGNLQLASHYPALLIPWRNPIWFEFMSHKMVRLLSPFLLMALLASNVWLVFAGEYSVFSIQCSVEIETRDTRHATPHAPETRDTRHPTPSSLNTEHCILNTVYRAALAVQLLFHLLAVIGLCQGRHSILTAAPAMFLRLNWTTLLAWSDALRKRYRVDWQRA